MVSGETPATAPDQAAEVEPAEAALLKAERKQAKKARKAEARRQRRKRLAILWIVIGIVAAILYTVVLIAYGRSTAPAPAPVPDNYDSVRVFIQPTEFSAATKLLNSDVSVSVPAELEGTDGQLNSAVHLLIFTETGTREIKFPAGTPGLALTSTTTLPLGSGQYSSYPIDKYSDEIGILVEVREPDGAVWYPAQLAIWGDLSGWRITGGVNSSGIAEPMRTTDPPAPAAAFTDVSLRRAGSTLSIVVLMLASMVAVTAVALVVAFAVSRRLRRTEATMASWFAALLFAMVPLRLNMPGAPPIGVWIDFLVFMWVLLGLMLALVVFISTWVRFSPRPEIAPKAKRKSPPSGDKPAKS